jgi:hypothetical protein
MGDEFYSIIKLISGEEIFSLVSVDDNDGEPIIILQNPVVIKTIIHHGNTLIKIKPWIEISTDDIYVIRYDRIITMTETKDKKIIDLYNNYVESSDGDEDTISKSGKVDISTTMGYVSSVEDAREKLEKIFKGLKES